MYAHATISPEIAAAAGVPAGLAHRSRVLEAMFCEPEDAERSRYDDPGYGDLLDWRCSMSAAVPLR